MKIKLKDFLDLLYKKDDEIVELATEGKEEFAKEFIKDLFQDIHNESSIDECTCYLADNFSSKHLDLSEVFAHRHGLFSDYIDEILAERDSNTIKSSTDMDDIYEQAGYRYLSGLGHNCGTRLLTVYSMREAYNELSKLDNNLELDCSEWGDYADGDDLINSFVGDISSQALMCNDIKNIQDYSKELCNDYFNLDL